MHFHARLRVDALARHRGALTHSQLARLTGIDRSTLVNAEAGRRQLGLTSVLMLAHVLGVRVEDLVELVDDDGHPLISTIKAVTTA